MMETTEQTIRTLTETELLPLMEAYLFVAVEPIKPAEIAKVLGVGETAVEDVLNDLVERYDRRINSGLHVLKLSGGYQIATKPDLSQDIARLLALPKDKTRLSKPALETLAVIAYQQPVTQAQIEAVRGVNVDGVVKTLLERRLIQDDGRLEAPGRPILYITTPEFLHYFGLNSLNDLPPLEDIEPAALETAQAQALQAVGLEE